MIRQKVRVLMDWTELLSKVLYAVLAVVVPIITKALIDFIKAKSSATIAGIKNEALRIGVQDAMNAVYTAVTTVNQTYVDEMKSKNMFDAAAQKEALEKSMDLAKELMTQAAKDAINSLYGLVDPWLTANIETAVKEEKSTK